MIMGHADCSTTINAHIARQHVVLWVDYDVYTVL